MNNTRIKNINYSLFCLLLMFFSCRGQSVKKTLEKNIDGNPSQLQLGEIVPALGDGVIIVYQDKKNNYWFGGNGIYMYDGENITHFTSDDGLCNDGFYAIQEDHLGNIYFDAGACVSKFDGNTFTTLPMVKNDSVKNNWKLDKDDLWFRGTWDKNGPYRYDGDSLHHLEFPKHEFEDDYYAGYPNSSFSPYGIYTIYTDRMGNVWFGTSNFGACRYNGKSINWISEEELTELDDGPAPGVRSILEDNNGEFWFSNDLAHRYRISNKTDEVEHSTFTYNAKPGIAFGENLDLIDSFLSIVEDANGNLWGVTYDEGVWKYDGSGFIHYPVKDGNEDITLFSIYKDNQDVLWLGSHQHGVYQFNGEKFVRF